MTGAPAPALPPLDGIRVVCLASQFPGPFGCSVLSDLGAQVVLVERPGGDPLRQMPWLFDAVNRGASSVVADLKTPRGRDHVLGLVEKAHAVVEGFRPGVADRLGVGPEACRALRPELVYVSVSGFGPNGPDRDVPAHDLGYQAVAGLLDAELFPGLRRSPGGIPPGLPIADLAAGVFAAIAVLTGLVRAERRQTGSVIDVAMVDAVLTLAGTAAVPRLNGTGPAAVPFDPAYGVFTASDGVEVCLSVAFEDPFWRQLCAELGMDELSGLGGWARRADGDRLRQLIAARIAARPGSDLLDALRRRDVPATRVNSLDDLAADPHFHNRAMITEVAGTRYVRQPLLVDGVAYGPRAGSPSLGEDQHQLPRSTFI